MLRAKPLLALTLAISFAGATALVLSQGHSRAVQAPRMSLDMVHAGNSYDQNTNTMTVGTMENCSTSAPPGNNARHNHLVALIIQDVEDFIGWQARLNYDGGRMRPLTANFTPFSDAARGQSISFANLPIDSATGVHREVVNASQIPPAAEGPQTAAIGSVYVGPQNAPISPDTPAKAPPDDTSYSAPSGGILATMILQVLPGQAGQGSLTMDLDDGSPNAPGSGVAVFDGTGSREVLLEENALFDGFHGEGVACVPPAGIPPVQGEDPGFAEGEPPPGGGTFGTFVPGATSPGTSPGDGAGQGGASPSQSGTASPTPDDEASDDDGASESAGDEGGGGTPLWLYVLIVIIVALAAGGAFAAWRYRSRLPWLRGRF